MVTDWLITRRPSVDALDFSFLTCSFSWAETAPPEASGETCLAVWNDTVGSSDRSL
jgi:hypothetical protein